jgi:phosphate/sulfate permease
MPILLDMTGIILLSSAAMVWHLIAGLVAAGLGCFVLNWRVYERG